MSLLADWIAKDATRPVAPAVTEFAETLAARGGRSTVAVLFYGSSLRTGDLEGLLDFYVVLDSFKEWHGSTLAALANRLVPPTVEFSQYRCGDRLLRGKVAVLSIDQLLDRTRTCSLDTTLWARFAQPSALVWSRDDYAKASIHEALRQAFVTAARWACILGPVEGTAEDYWRALFRETFRTELRVEGRGRADEIVAFARERYVPLLVEAWKETGIEVREEPGGRLRPGRNAGPASHPRWLPRRLVGKPLNILRLIKATFSFEGGVDYMLWKIERHAGVKVPMSPWQRRHPILAAPLLLWRLWRGGVIR